MLALLFWVRNKKPAFAKISVLFVSIAALIGYFTYFHFSEIQVRNSYLDPDYLNNFYYYIEEGTEIKTKLSHFLVHYISSLSVIGMAVLMYSIVKKLVGKKSVLTKISLWTSVAIGLFVLTSETDHLVVLLSYTTDANLYDIAEQSRKIAWPVLWGISSFVLMVLGMKLKLSHLRIMSLSLFFVTLLKLFLYDIQDIHPAGKIAAFISLGILLLIVSFMYQKIKWVVQDEAKDKADSEINQ